MDEVSGEVGQVGQVEVAAGAEVHLKHLRTAKVLRLYVYLANLRLNAIFGTWRGSRVGNPYSGKPGYVRCMLRYVISENQ